jgi:hypothetical protein
MVGLLRQSNAIRLQTASQFAMKPVPPKGNAEVQHDAQHAFA